MHNLIIQLIEDRMKYTSEYDSINNICIVYVDGKIQNPNEADELKQFAHQFFTEHGCRHFLFDMKQTDISFGTIDVFVTGAPQGEMAKALKPFKVSVVVSKITENLRFFENVAVNRGFNVNVFDDVFKAIEWLKPEIKYEPGHYNQLANSNIEQLPKN